MEFRPLSIVTHYNYQNILLIVFDEIVAVVSTQSSIPELIQIMEVPDYGKLLADNFILTSNFLWNIRSDGLYLHDSRDEKNFNLLYEVEIFDYIFVNPEPTGLQYVATHPSDFIYVLGEKFDASGKSWIVLMIFRESGQSVQNLYKVVDTGIPYQKTSSITLAADGSTGVDYVLLNVDG